MKICGYTFTRVDDDELLHETFRLRYDIYCREAEFLNDSQYPDGIEKDIYDEHSIHFAALDREKHVVGTLRMILNSDHGFPLEEHCPNYDKTKIPRLKSQLAEISRLAVAKSSRRRINDGLYGMTSYHASAGEEIPAHIRKRRKNPVIVFGLYKLLYLESKRRGITHWYAAMEQKLNHTLSRFNFPFEAIGPVHDYYGPVIPFLGSIATIEQHLYRQKPLVAHLMMYGLDRHLMPQFGFAFPARNFVIYNMARFLGKV
jgi:N-acyl amino acid synthase of PEP-CTERM/exosortase system